MKANIPPKLKLSNRKIVYGLLVENDGISRADLTRMTGISGATVVKIIDCFHRKGIVSYDAVDSAATNVGRRPTPLRFNRNFAHIIAVYAEGAYASVGMVNAVGETVACREVKISSYDDYFSRGLFEDIDAVAAESGIAVESCIGIGVALPVSFDETSLEIRRPPLIDSQITDLTGLRQALCDRYRLPVLLENDVNASAYGEYRREYAASVRDMVYLSLGTGLGSGLILNGALRRGRHNSAGEIGYMTLDAAGSDAGEMGWLESRVNFEALLERFHADAADLMRGFQTGRIIEYLSDYVALAVFNIQTLLDVDLIVLGGMLSDYLGGELLEAVRRKVERRHMESGVLRSGRLKHPGFAGLGYLLTDHLLDRLLDDDDEEAANA